MECVHVHSLTKPTSSVELLMVYKSECRNLPDANSSLVYPYTLYTFWKVVFTRSSAKNIILNFYGRQRNRIDCFTPNCMYIYVLDDYYQPLPPPCKGKTINKFTANRKLLLQPCDLNNQDSEVIHTKTVLICGQNGMCACA